MISPPAPGDQKRATLGVSGSNWHSCGAAAPSCPIASTVCRRAPCTKRHGHMPLRLATAAVRWLDHQSRRRSSIS